MCRAALSPEYGLFSASSDETIHPFPTAHILHPNAPKLYKFLGKAGMHITKHIEMLRDVARCCEMLRDVADGMAGHWKSNLRANAAGAPV